MPDTLAMLSRLGVTFERTASVRDEADLEEVLQDVAGAIGEVLGYRAVVVNVYRPAYDDMLAAAAVGSEESVRQLVGKSSPSDTWTPMFVPRFERGGAYFLPDGEFDWESLGIDTYVPELPASEDPDAWLPGDALFVPLRDGRGNLLGAISVDEPETGRRPSDRRARGARDHLAPRRAGSADRAEHGQRRPAPAHARARARGIRSAGRGGRRRRRPPGGVRRHRGCARLRQGRHSAGGHQRRPAAAHGRHGMVDRRPSHEPRHHHRHAHARAHRGVRGGRLLPHPRGHRQRHGWESRSAPPPSATAVARMRGRGTGCSCRCATANGGPG